MSRFSVIIPVLNEASWVGSLLRSLEPNTDVEVIVVDGGSTDGTREVVSEFPDVIYLHSKAGRGIQLNRGAEFATGEILWFLHADSAIPLNWKEAIIEILGKDNTVAGCFPLRFDANPWLLRFFGFLSRWNHPLVTYGDQGFFMRRSQFESIGGFRNFPILEDVEIQCRLRRVGRWGKARIALTTSSRRFLTQGILRQQLKNIGIVSLFLVGASPNRLARFYRPQCEIQERASDQSASLKPTALNESVRTNGRFTRFPFWVRRLKASCLLMLGSLSFRPRER